MYLGSDRMYYFAGDNVVQDFNDPTPGPAPYNRSSYQNTYTQSYGGDNEYQSTEFVQVRDQGEGVKRSLPPQRKGTLRNTHQNRDQEVVKRSSPPQRASSMRDTYNDNYNYNDPPQDLGPGFVKVLLNEFKRVRHINTKDPRVLLDFWRLNRKTNGKSMRGAQEAKTSERLRDLQAIAQEREEDVAYTLDVHAETLQQEENIKKLMMESYRRNQIEENMRRRTEKPKKMSKETLDRLYPGPKPRDDMMERPKSSQLPRSQTMQSSQMSQSEDSEWNFARRLAELHAQARPTERRHVDQDRLFAFWQGMPNKHENKMNRREDDVREDIQRYFFEKYDVLQNAYKAKYGYQTFNHRDLLNFYRNELSDFDKKRKEIDFDPYTLEKPLERYCAKRKQEYKDYEQNAEEEQRRREKEDREKLARIAIKKDIQATGIDNLAKPKDNLKKGKTMLFLKKMFPNDRILQKMILTEFRRNKLSKYPEEYDIYDSDHEIETKQRDKRKDQPNADMQGGRTIQISRSDTLRERELAAPFKQHLEREYMSKNEEIEENETQQEKEQKEEKQLDRFIAARVRRFLDMRKRRLYERIPTLKEFLIQTYREMKQSYPEATERKYPHITYGYSQRLKKNSYPIEFKRDFFLRLRSISRGTKMSHGRKLLPFWAPTSAGSKANVFLDTNKSYNKRVNELSRETKIKKIEEDYDKDNCWQKDEFHENRKHIMMTLSDAKECTFTPNVGTKMPNQYKDLMLQEYGNWASQFLTENKESVDEWVNAMGANLTKRFPTIYKYGKFKRAVRFWKEDQHIKAYKEIAEAFNINQIKKYFDKNFDPSSFETTMYTPENLKLENDGPKPQEDFGTEPNKRFLEDVYVLIIFLENHEKDLKKSIREIESRAEQDKMRTRTNTLLKGTKTMMCPLGDKCPDDIRPRWPTSSKKTISKFGHKCEFAHHPFELRFEEEVKAQKAMLNNTLNGLSKKLDGAHHKPPFNPAGNVITGCIGCGEELKTKGVSKGVCSYCQLKKSVNKKLQGYRQKAANKFVDIVNQASFKENYQEKHQLKERLNKKMGYYRKACVLHETERYRDAFTFIAKAVEMVKEEKSEEEDKEQKKSNELKAKLGIDPSIPITLDMLYNTENVDNLESDRNNDGQFGLSRAKLIAYAEKMGYLGDQKVDVNEFLNHQIEDMYLKIEKALQDKVKDINRMEQKIEKLEGFNHDVEEKMAKPQGEGAKLSLSAITRMKRALKKKGKHDIDLVGNEKKVENLQKTIKYIKDEIEQSKPPEPWRPSRTHHSILETDKYDKMMSDKKPKKDPRMKTQDLGHTAREEKEKTKSIYNRDLDELLKSPHERTNAMY